MMPSYIREEYEKLHPFQKIKFHELCGWGSTGGDNPYVSDIAYLKALEWAKQVEIPLPAPPAPEPEEE